MMRITNSMMTTNTKNNININKLNEDEKNTQVATGQKISRPSDDPVIAIRALRFNTTLSQLNQYHDKNIPDSDAWLKVTETALKQTDTIFTKIKENLTKGASDDNTANDRMKILESLKGLRSEFYATGNADYAGRTVFTGYRTGEPLTFLATDTDKNDTYRIHQGIDKTDIDKITHITTNNTGDANQVRSVELSRIRLPYDNLDVDGDPEFNIYEEDPETGIKTKVGELSNITVQSIAGKTQEEIDKLYVDIADHKAYGYFIPETGELLLCPCNVNEIEGLKENQSIEIEYNKSSWQTNDVRPEHYFACEKTPKDGTASDTVKYNYSDEVNKKTGVPTGNRIPDFKNQTIEVEISFNQKIGINTNASDVYSHDIGRDIDELLIATQDVIDVDKKLDSYKELMSKAKTDAEKEAAQKKLDEANKEFALKKDRMQKMFSEALDIFEGYADKNNKVIADIGSTSQRLEITKDRVEDQLQSFKELADGNININLTDAAIDLSSASLALQAAQMAAGKISQQTLLNYI